MLTDINLLYLVNDLHGGFFSQVLLALVNKDEAWQRLAYFILFPVVVNLVIVFKV